MLHQKNTPDSWKWTWQRDEGSNSVKNTSTDTLNIEDTFFPGTYTFSVQGYINGCLSVPSDIVEVIIYCSSNLDLQPADEYSSNICEGGNTVLEVKPTNSQNSCVQFDTLDNFIWKLDGDPFVGDSSSMLNVNSSGIV